MIRSDLLENAWVLVSQSLQSPDIRSSSNVSSELRESENNYWFLKFVNKNVYYVSVSCF